MIFSKNEGTEQDSNYYVVENYEIRKLQPDYLESFFAGNAAFPLKSTTASFQSPENTSTVEQPATKHGSENQSHNIMYESNVP